MQCFFPSTATGKMILTMLARFAELERSNIKESQLAGLERARAEGMNLGRKKVIDDDAVAQWRQINSASIKATADHFGISSASVKRACRNLKKAS
ncbi:recombinase family protein [Billgrantia sp. Q4P2]|uniref:recombinase family protein n=1 Tax=Billgrantia sp. Q4P2 TaxID=3463857 RepID=UPI004057354F